MYIIPRDKCNKLIWLGALFALTCCLLSSAPVLAATGNVAAQTSDGPPVDHEPAPAAVGQNQVLAAVAAGTLYDSIPVPLPGSFSSLGYEATSTDEFGDHVELIEGGRTLSDVTVSLTNWACENDFTWNGNSWIANRASTDACVTTPGSTFEHPITVNLYAVDDSGIDPGLGALLASKTLVAEIPFRPSHDGTNCTTGSGNTGALSPADDVPFGGTWYDATSGNCFHGYAFMLSFDFSSEAVVVPQQVIATVAYNTNNHGVSPLGVAGPYSSLNVSLTEESPSIGINVEADAAFWDTSYGPFYSDNGVGGTDTLRRDENWNPYTPVIRINAVVCTDVTNADTGETFCTIQAAIDDSDTADGHTLNIAAGTYVEALNVDKELTLTSAGVADVIIDASSFEDYSIEVTKSNVTLEGFTLLGNATGSASYGIKVAGPSPTQLTNITIRNVKVDGSRRSGIDLNGVDGATIENVEVTNAPSGNGLALSDSSNVTATNITTSNNAWGGFAIYTFGRYFPLGADNITIGGTNSFGEANKVYVEIGNYNDPANPGVVTNLNVAGFDYIVRNDTFRAGGENFTFYQIDQADAIAFALGLDAPEASYVNELATGDFWVGQDDTDSMTIQAAINHASAGATINVLPGLFVENVTVDEQVKIVGSGSGEASCSAGDFATATIVQPAAGIAFSVSASGTAADPLLLQNVRIELPAAASRGLELATLDHLKLDGVRVIGHDPVNSTSQIGLRAGTAVSITNLTAVNSSFQCLGMGWYLPAANSGTTVFDVVTIQNSEFSENAFKGIYVEKLSNALIEGNTFRANAQYNNLVENLGVANAAGLDINLKYASYSNITVRDNSFTDEGLGAREGAALMIKARDDGSYASPGATLDNVLIEGNTLAGNERGIRFGEPGNSNAGPTNVVVRQNNITGSSQTHGGTDGSAYGGLVSFVQALIDARLNWWGDASGPGGDGPGTGDAIAAVVGPVAFCPWLDAPYPTGAPTAGPATVTNSDTGEVFCSIQAAIDDSDTASGHTLTISAGARAEEVHVTKSLTIRGESAATTILQPTQDTAATGDAQGWWRVDASAVLNLRELTFDGAGFQIYQALRHQGSGTVENAVFQNILYELDGLSYAGTAIAAFGDGPVDVTNSQFSNIGRVGVLYAGASVDGSAFTGNSYTGKGDGDYLDYALEISSGAGVTASNNTITANRGRSSTDGATSAALRVLDGGVAAITTNAVQNNATGLLFEAGAAVTQLTCNNIFGNATGARNETAGAVVASDNWWGASDGPTPPGSGDTIVGSFIISPAAGEQDSTCAAARAYELGYFHASRSGEAVAFRWQTIEEISTQGFRLYAEVDGELVLLTPELIPTVGGDASAPPTYDYLATSGATRFFVDEVQEDGTIVRHGPFEFGVEYGSYKVPNDVTIEPAAYLPLIVGE